ncbi:hypothetical protein LSTR_LSTR008956 [Laodelphax striatellus]|uniref:Uncharacterized protein n=1 Tax=Laodelphax striatellus TaxID=195883 RepID=A0A482WK23_LAOST|nr:hypothetical protein LSTR_LSTR008956 [Laodelphax striatellus]
MLSIIIILFVVASNIQQASLNAVTPAAVNLNRAPIDYAVDGLYICVEGATGHGKISEDRVHYWNRRHPLNFIVETLVKQLPMTYEEAVFKSLLRNQATVMIAGLELCKPTIYGYNDAGLQTVLKLSNLLANQFIDVANKAGNLIEGSIPYHAMYETLRGNLTNN